MLSAPTSTAPAASSRSISAASRAAGGWLRLILEPASVGSPLTSYRFLTANGTPASGPGGRPWARAASIAFALSRALASTTAVNALSAGSRFAIRASAASVIASALWPPATAPAISEALAQSIALPSSLEDGRGFGLVRQDEARYQSAEPQGDLEMAAHRRQPGLRDLQVE